MSGFGLRSAAVLGKRLVTGVSPTFRAPYGATAEPAMPDADGKFDAGKYFDEMQRLRGSRGPALTAYQSALNEMPTRETTKPSILRRIGGTVAGGLAGMRGGPAAGMETAAAFVDSPYKQAMEQYGGRMRNLGESARLEQDETESSLKALQEARALGLKYDEFDLKKMEAGNLNKYRTRQGDIAEGNLDVNRENADTNRAGQRNTAQYRTGQLGVARRNAATGERNASTGKTNSESLAAYRTGMLKIGGDRNTILKDRTGRPATPQAQQDAIDNSLRQMKANPRYKNYVTGADTSDNPIGMAEDDNTTGYVQFMRELKRITEQQLKKGSPFADDDFGNTDEEDDLIIEPQ